MSRLLGEGSTRVAAISGSWAGVIEVEGLETEGAGGPVLSYLFVFDLICFGPGRRAIGLDIISLHRSVGLHASKLLACMPIASLSAVPGREYRFGHPSSDLLACTRICFTVL